MKNVLISIATYLILSLVFAYPWVGLIVLQGSLAYLVYLVGKYYAKNDMGYKRGDELIVVFFPIAGILISIGILIQNWDILKKVLEIDHLNFQSPIVFRSMVKKELDSD